MTQRLYYEDAYLAGFDARVHEVRALEGGYAVRLDRSAFYPTSGGQPFDTGTLGGARVIDVTRSVAESLNMLRAGVVLVRVVPYVPGQALDCMGSEARETLGSTGLKFPAALPSPEEGDQSR